MSNETDGMSELTITSIVPYFNVANGDYNRLIPLKNLSKMSTPINAALVLSDAENETVALVSVSNISLYEDTSIIILKVKPLEFYNGETLKTFNQARSDLSSSGNQTGMCTSIYLELYQVPTNGRRKFNPEDPSPLLG